MMDARADSINLKEVGFFSDLPREDLAVVRACLHERSFDKGESLLWEGKPCERVFIVQEGMVKIFRMNPSGREQILEVLRPGETCACNPGEKSWSCLVNAEAMSRCKV